MTTVNLLKKFRKLNVKLWLEEERLCYSAAKGVLTPELREELSARKEEVLTFLRSVVLDKTNAPSPLVPVSRDEPLPLSFAQQRLWFLDQFNPGSSTYNIPLAVRFNGVLDLDALARSFAELVRRHESLRTTFHVVGEQPTQFVAPAFAPQLPLTDLSHLNASEREIEVERQAGEEAQRSFDLAAGPLLRLRVLRLSAEEHVLLLTMHHIVSDGWSMGVLVREVTELYGAYTQGHESPLADLPIQYADYAVWQREHLTGEVLERQLSYWREQLNEVATLELPTDRLRPAERSYRGARMGITLSAELTWGLRELSRREGATLFMTLLAGFQTLLARYTNQTDISVGTPIANRNRAETEGLIGFFVNTLVMRTDFSDDPTFRELLRRVRETALGAYANQDVPFERLVEELQPARSPGHSPLFQVAFALQNAPSATPTPVAGGLRMSSVGGGESQTAKFDLTLALGETDDAVTASFEYSTELFEAGTIERMAGHFVRLLGAAVLDPERRVSELEMLGAGERRRLLYEFNETGREYERGVCLHELFERQVGRTPDACAIVFAEQQLSFAQLDARANQLARHLRRLGVGHDSIVAVCLERSIEMVVGLLGILKAGAAYLPLDPSHPKDRLAFAVADARSRVVLTQERLRHVLTPAPGTHVLCLDADWQSVVAAESAEPSRFAVAPDNLAYVIYTSGSTGTPKGVMVTHRAITNHMRWMQERLPLSETDCVLQKTPFTFDASVWEFFLPLMSGARMLLARPGGHQDGAYLLETIDERGVTILQMVPTMLRVLLEEAAGAARGRSLRRVCCGGEPLTADLRERFHALLDAELYNLYGPTEAAVDATYWHSDPSIDELSVPIGHPVANTQVFILDGRLQPVPVGVAGELYLGGEGLARGYLNQPGLTAERFVPDLFAVSPGARLYRTGDLARYRHDGRIEFVGRADHQVKLRGFRIEVGEIESVLSRHAAVSDAVVVVREDVPGDRRLVAYVVGEEGATVAATSTELRAHLRGQLPEYMIPAAFVTLAQMPLTTSGKTDRRALPAPEKLSHEASPAFVAPRDALELKLAQLWGDVFSTPPVGVKDDFFELGGHSMLAVRLFALIEKQFGRRIPMAMLFQRTTVEQLAELLRQEPDAGEWSPLVEIQKGGTAPPFFCVHPVGGNVLCYFELARHLGPEQPFYAFQARVTGDAHTGQKRIEEMAAAYVEALRVVQPGGPYFLGGWSLGGVVAFEMARRLRAAGEEVAFLGLIDSFAPSSADDAHAQESNPDPDRVSDTHDELRLLAHFAKDLGLPSHGYAEARAALADATTEQRLDYLVERAKEAGLVPPYMNREQVAALYEVFKTNISALRKYRPQAGCQRITLLASEQSASAFGEATLGWRDLSSEEVEVYTVPGTHYSMVKQPSVVVLADRLRDCLTKAGAAAMTRT